LRSEMSLLGYLWCLLGVSSEKTVKISIYGAKTQTLTFQSSLIAKIFTSK
jgi:hypothetical protein